METCTLSELSKPKEVEWGPLHLRREMQQSKSGCTYDEYKVLTERENGWESNLTTHTSFGNAG